MFLAGSRSARVQAAGGEQERRSGKLRGTLSAVLFFSLLFVQLQPLSANDRLGLSDEALLDLISRKAFDYFTAEKHPVSGLVSDRAPNFKRSAGTAFASIAGTGFGLTALGVGVHRGWIDRESAASSVGRTLDFFLHQAQQEKGFFYHFMDPKTGKRSGKSELSPIDTALFLAGALFAAEYFEDPEIRSMAEEIYRRVQWPWMLNGGKTLSLAWTPEEGFNKRRWDHYDESMILYLLAIGSQSHPLPPSVWGEIARPAGSYAGHRLIQMPPLFTHQYSHIWIDFRNKNDGHADYFLNSVRATLANREFCIRQASKFSTYGPNSWGLTASDGPFGYRAYGAPPGWAAHDGTLAPTACGASIVFTPKESMACLRHFYEKIGAPLWGTYGFSDAFNLDRGWFAEDVLAIDQGALLLMIENYRSGLIWETMKKNRELSSAMEKAGFREGTFELPWPDPPRFKAAHLPQGLRLDGYLKDWPGSIPLVLDKKNREVGHFQDDDKDLRASARFAWSPEALYFSVIVTDDSVIAKRKGPQIALDDIVELYIDPDGDGLKWKDSRDFQIGFRPEPGTDDVQIWSWFQPGQESGRGMIAARGFTHENGYVIEGGIRWPLLDFEPEEGRVLKLSLAVHDIDKDRSEGKIQWFFRNEEDFERFNLGEIVLEPRGGFARTAVLSSGSEGAPSPGESLD